MNAYFYGLKELLTETANRFDVAEDAGKLFEGEDLVGRTHTTEQGLDEDEVDHVHACHVRPLGVA